MSISLATVVLLLLSLSQTTVCSTSAIITALCPTDCSCSMIEGGRLRLSVDCHGRVEVDGGQLSMQLDTLLSVNLTYGRLRELSIVNSPLTLVPRSVCRLTSLTRLRLDNNRLTRLPDNCLTNLTSLLSLGAPRNSITGLQDGLFDGLRQLDRLELTGNRISSIGLRVFNGSSMLTSLKYVDLSYNRIQTLEPWPDYVGINGRRLSKAPIDLSFNRISSFTNMMGWKARCDSKIVYFILTLSYNPIKHIRHVTWLEHEHSDDGVCNH